MEDGVILNIEKRRYFSNGMTDRREIFHCDAV